MGSPGPFLSLTLGLFLATVECVCVCVCVMLGGVGGVVGGEMMVPDSQLTESSAA